MGFYIRQGYVPDQREYIVLKKICKQGGNKTKTLVRRFDSFAEIPKAIRLCLQKPDKQKDLTPWMIASSGYGIKMGLVTFLLQNLWSSDWDDPPLWYKKALFKLLTMTNYILWEACLEKFKKGLVKP